MQYFVIKMRKINISFTVITEPKGILDSLKTGKRKCSQQLIQSGSALSFE